ncbi:MAG: tetratricopeptide repeat protein [Hyphomonadaceae bacterium]|nr:tetratricopeptide repeat protein [Hyphomonadaceae bacterium]
MIAAGGADDSTAEAYFFRGTLRNAVGDYVGAISDLTESVRLSPRSPGGFVNRGNAYMALGNYERALADYDHAISIDQQHAVAFMHRGIAFRRQGDLVRAISDYTEAIRLQPRFEEAFLNRGSAYVATGDLTRAIADYDEAIRLDPNYAKAYNGRCWARAVLRQNLGLALDDCNRALTLSPGDPASLDSRGLVHLELGNFDHAIADYDAVLLREPQNSDAIYGRGVALVGAGRTAEGQEVMDRAIELDPQVAQRFAGGRYGTPH